jgi:hypothetical protein
MEDFVEVIDDVLTEETCLNLIKSFEYADKCGLSYQRFEAEQSVAQGLDSLKKDTSLGFSEIHCEGIASVVPDTTVPFTIEEINKSIFSYVNKYQNGIVSVQSVEQGGIPLLPTGYKLQRTRPSEGYHVWHCENSCIVNKARCLSWILYLNDIEDGGETEFLYLSKRVKPKAGRLIIFPAGFTHTHRGNPPLSETKYVATGWLEYRV